MLRAALAFLIVLGVVAGPAGAQAPDRKYRIGFLGQTTAAEMTPQLDALRDGLRALGYEEDRNLAIEYRWGERRVERLPALAKELAARKVDLIVTHGSAGARAAKDATSTIPIVLAVVGDPVANGLVASLARPGGNVTGLTLQEYETTVKWLDFLRQILPPNSQIGWLDVPDVESAAAAEASRRKEDEAARVRGYTIQRVEVRSPGDLAQAFERLSRDAHAVVVPNSSFLNPSAPLIARLATTYRLPTVGSTALARAGVLIGYGADSVEMFRRAARYVDEILKGAKPGELAMEGPPKLELVVNLQAARTLGIRLPDELVRQANQRLE
jgi:putative ABC transport system substrate-binding protein